MTRLQKIKYWAIAWRDYWIDHEELQKMICSYYDKPAAAARIKRYQVVLDAIDGELKMPPENWLSKLNKLKEQNHEV